MYGINVTFHWFRLPIERFCWEAYVQFKNGSLHGSLYGDAAEGYSKYPKYCGYREKWSVYSHLLTSSVIMVFFTKQIVRSQYGFYLTYEAMDKNKIYKFNYQNIIGFIAQMYTNFNIFSRRREAVAS